MNTSVREVMAKHDCKMRELNDATNLPMIESPSPISSSFSDIDVLNNCPKCTKKPKKIGDQSPVTKFLKEWYKIMNPIARSLMAKYDKGTDNIKSSSSRKQNSITWSYFSNVELLNNHRKRRKLIKKTGDQRPYVEFIKDKQQEDD